MKKSSPDTSESSVLLAHDSFTQYGGAERVFSAMARVFPNAPVFTLVREKEIEERYHLKHSFTSWLQKLYKILPRFQWLFPLVPLVLRTSTLPHAKVLLSSSSAYLKGIDTPGSTVHINYCHTPTRFLWTDYHYALGEIHWLLRPLARLYFEWLKKWDVRAAQKVDIFLANSNEVKQRIKKYYDRDATVVYPYIDIHFWKKTKPTEDYFLIAGRLTPYKNHDLIITIFRDLGLKLHVAGEGRYEQHLRDLAGDSPNIIFCGQLDDQQLREQYSGAKGVIFPQIEDFGLIPIEAAACGTPTIGRAIAGSLETIIPGKTGELLDEFTPEKLTELLQHWNQGKYDLQDMRDHAERFSEERFAKQISTIVNRFL